MEGTYKKTDNATFCNNIKCQTKNEAQIIDICKMFVSLYNNTMTECDNNLSKPECKKYPEFMNFWLNYKLKETGYSETEQSQFYKEITDNYDKFKKEDILKNNLYVIVEKYFNNMNTLYKLYKMLYSPSKAKYKNCDDFMEEFKKIYNGGLKKCYHHGDVKLGKGLEIFKNIYTTDNLNKVPLLDTEDDDILRTSYIARKLLQNKYEYSMDFLHEIKDNYYKDLKDLISVHYNLLFEYKEEEKNCLMIRILHQFFQYCNDYKYNRRLSLFMKEFIDEYYNEKQTEYKKIFTECKGPKNGKKYCTLFKQCENTFNKDLKIFENKASDYITEQENYIISLTGFDILLFEAKAMFQDFEKMSRYLPTIMSTMVAILICLFFLYKVLKIYI
ncbi:hypothetical protein PVNG_05880 [Plasmodium vivax North Korean]|uniref:Uncharacterized protein n=1 Tax=Plasmodium vivax North Korean TaxID=1035514 RepID=A0A0J9TMY0_PLAVI|nr:hypothetical protein PVNG_05880 [Plasmodium vivax North Korean]